MENETEVFNPAGGAGQDSAPGFGAVPTAGVPAAVEKQKPSPKKTKPKLSPAAAAQKKVDDLNQKIMLEETRLDETKAKIEKLKSMLAEAEKKRATVQVREAFSDEKVASGMKKLFAEAGVSFDDVQKFFAK